MAVTQLSGLTRSMIGGLGGVAALCTNYLAQYHPAVENLIKDGQANQILMLLFGFFILIPIVVFLGGLIGWASSENNRMKLIAIGVSAPALITTWNANPIKYQTDAVAVADKTSSQPGDQSENLYFISPAKAKDKRIVVAATSWDLSDKFRSYFSVQKFEPKYWVIVKSLKDQSQAQAFANRINALDPGLRAFVGKRRPDNPYYPVIVGNFSERSEALRLRDRAVKLDIIDSASLSSYAMRK